MIKVINFKKLRSGSKKYEITFEKNGKKYIRKFGAEGMSDYTIHKDKERRERYISRHKKDLRTKDPMKPGYLSMYILWNKPTIKASLADYKRRLNVYNKTGKFPTKITGSKKLSSFGVSSIIPQGTSLDRLPDDILNIIEEDLAKRRLREELPKFTARPFNVPARGLGRQYTFAERLSGRKPATPKEESRKAKVKLMYVLKELRRKSLKESQPGRAYTDPSTVPISLARTMSEQQKEEQVNYYANYFNDITSDSGSIITKELSKLEVSEFKYRQNLWWYLVYKGLQLYLDKLIELGTVSVQSDEDARVHNSGYHLISVVRKVCDTQPLGRGPCANMPSGGLQAFARWAISVWEDSSSFEIPRNPPRTFNFRNTGAPASYAERLLARPSPLTPQEQFLTRQFLARRRAGASTEDASRAAAAGVDTSYDDLDQAALSFGESSIIPREGTYLERLPDDVFDEMIQRPRSGEFITKNLRKARQRQALKIVEMLREIGEEKYKRIGSPSSKAFVTNLILNYDITQDSGVRITNEMAKLLTKEDFRGKSFWWRLVLDGLQQIQGLIEEGEALPGAENINFEINREVLTEIIVPRYVVPPRGAAVTDIIELWENFDNNVSFGKKQKTKGSKIPDNVVNKALYSRIKAKIRKDVNKKKRRWGAYDSGRLVREYKAKGGKYRGGKAKGKTNLGRWYKEKWVDACAWPKRKSCGRKTKEKIAYCRPSKKIDSKTPKLVQKLTKAQIKSRCAKKKRNPMKRVTKFGNVSRIPRNATDALSTFRGRDENRRYPGSLNDYVTHCTNWEGVGPHFTVRYRPARPGYPKNSNQRVPYDKTTDISWHFGMYQNMAGTIFGPFLWYSQRARELGLGNNMPEALICELVGGYNACINNYVRINPIPDHLTGGRRGRGVQGRARDILLSPHVYTEICNERERRIAAAVAEELRERERQRMLNRETGEIITMLRSVNPSSKSM